MKVSDSLINAAFGQHRRRYATEAAWDVTYHVKLWSGAQSAFGTGGHDAFNNLYSELRANWQVFRGGTSHWEVDQAFDAFCNLDATFRSKRLSDLGLGDVPSLWALLQSVEPIKVLKYGPSVVAISKFLHFWNPRLFMIVDDGVIWKWVFAHRWIWNDLLLVRNEIDQLLGGVPKRPDVSCDNSTYLAILVWCSRLLRENPMIVTSFAAYVLSHVHQADAPADLPGYESAAVEWFLLGVVEVPPAGIE